MINNNTKLNIILGVLCVVLLIVIIYIIGYRNNIESANVYFNQNDIKNINWKDNDTSFYTNGKTFTFIKNGETIYDNEPFKLDNHTGVIIDGRLYLRGFNETSIVLWYDEAEYRLNKN